jgi:dienelactone hydrolase
MYKINTAFLFLVFSVTVQAEIKTENFDYQAGKSNMKGFIAYDDAIKGKRPGVLVVHEWWGHNDYARKRARMLASLGYTAMSLDMYGDGKLANHPKDAGKFSGAIKKNMPLATERFQAAMKLLKKHNTTDSDRIAAIGYCFGGGIVLNMARQGLDLKGVASFHGSLGASVKAKKNIKTEVLVLNGAADPFTKPESIKAFKKEMAAAGIKYKFINYKNAKHAFTNPDADKFGKQFKIPLAYNKKADKESWAEMKRFLKRIF